MGPFRFRVRRLMGLVLAVSLGLAALRQADALWDSLTLAATFGTLLVAVLLAIHRRGERRAFWIGFALFGWAYLAMTMIPSVEPRLPTSRVLGYLDSFAPGRMTSFSLENRGRFTYPQIKITDGTSAVGLVRAWGGNSENFVRIGHSLFALILAGIGGVISRRLSLPSGDLDRREAHGSIAAE